MSTKISAFVGLGTLRRYRGWRDAPAIPWFVRLVGIVHVGLLGTHCDTLQWLSEVVDGRLLQRWFGVGLWSVARAH